MQTSSVNFNLSTTTNPSRDDSTPDIAHHVYVLSKCSLFNACSLYLDYLLSRSGMVWLANVFSGNCHSARVWREDELPVHPSSSRYQCRWQAEDHVRFDQDQGGWSQILQPGLQEGRCRSNQA